MVNVIIIYKNNEKHIHTFTNEIMAKQFTLNMLANKFNEIAKIELKG